MLESKTQAILAGQNQTIGFDSDIGDVAGAKSLTNTEFSAELSRAKDSITNDKLTRDTQNENTVASSQASAKSFDESGNPRTVKGQATTSESAIRNEAGSATETTENRLLKDTVSNAGQNAGVDGNASLTTARAMLVGNDSNLTMAVNPDGESQLAPTQLANKNIESTKPQVSADISGTQKKLTTFTGAESVTMTARESLLSAAAGEQYDQELVGSKYANNAATVVQRLHDDQNANQAQSVGAPIHADPTKSLADVAQSAEISERTVLAETAQKVESPLVTRNITTDTDEVVNASVSTSAFTKPGADESVATSSNVTATVKLDTVTGGAQANSAALSQNGIEALANADANRKGDTVNVALSATASIANSDVKGAQTSPIAAAMSAPLSDTQASSASVATSPNTNTVAQSTVAGHEFLRSIANTRPDAQSSNGNNIGISVNANLIDNEGSQTLSLPLTGKMVPQTGIASSPVQGTVVDPTVSVTAAQASLTKVDGSEALAMNTPSASKGVLAESASTFNGNSTGSQHNHQQNAAMLAGNADKSVTNTPAFNVAQNQNTEADVTPANKIKQLLGVKEQPDMAGLQAVKGAIDTPSSNVYHVTTNGIITANSTSLNAAPLSDLASAPRTVLLNQPDADQSLVENLRWAVNEKLSRVTVNVSPANLGPISVSVDVENQNMSVSIITNNVIAKEAIDSLLPRMREHFSSEGYQQVSVDVSSQQERNPNLRNQSAEFFNNQYTSDSESRTSDPQNPDSSQDDTASERSLFISEHRSSSHSLIDTYA